METSHWAKDEVGVRNKAYRRFQCVCFLFFVCVCFISFIYKSRAIAQKTGLCALEVCDVLGLCSGGQVHYIQ